MAVPERAARASARHAGQCLVELGGIEPPSESLCQADLHA